uniref:Uncharacterized protein n=1 Tax=Gadus morhua TaxID=8049 RepID=A0A8C5AQF0_GADMO
MIAPTLDPADAQFCRELEDLLWFIMKEMDYWENIPSKKEQEAIVKRTRRVVSSRPELKDALPEWAVELLSPTVFWPESYMPVPPDFCDRPKPGRSYSQPLPSVPRYQSLSPAPSYQSLSPAPSYQSLSPAPSYQPRPPVPSYQPRPPVPSYQPRPPVPSYQPRPPVPSYQPRPPVPSYQPRPPVPSYQPRPPVPSYQLLPPVPSYQPLPPVPSYQPLPLPSTLKGGVLSWPVVFWCVSLCFPPVLITVPSPNVSQLFLVVFVT